MNSKYAGTDSRNTREARSGAESRTVETPEANGLSPSLAGVWTVMASTPQAALLTQTVERTQILTKAWQ